MTPTIPDNEPASIIRGDSTKWYKGFSEYLPADGWALAYYFSSADASLAVTAADNGDGRYLVTLTTANTKQLVKGRVAWQATVTKAAERVTLASGFVDVVDGLAAETGNPLDIRSRAQRTLDAVEAEILRRVTGGAPSSVSINGRSISKEPISALVQLRDDLRQQVQIEEMGSKAGLGRQIRVRYGAF